MILSLWGAVQKDGHAVDRAQPAAAPDQANGLVLPTISIKNEFRALLVLAALVGTDVLGQSVTYSGRVVDSELNPVPGVSVQIEDVAEAGVDACCGPLLQTTTSETGAFMFEVTPSEYVITADSGPPGNRAFVRVKEAADSIELVVGAQPWTYLPDQPPVADKIAVGDPDATGRVTLTGAAGAVPADSYVIVQTLVTGHFAWTRADSTGSFSLDVFGPQGAYLYVQADPYGIIWRRGMRELRFGGEGSLAALPATMVRVPVEPAAAGIAFGDVGIIGDESYPVFWIEGVISENQLDPGSVLTVAATAIFESERISESFGAEIEVALEAQMLSGPDGNPRLARSSFASTMLTPTNLAIEREALPGFLSHISFGRHVITDNGDGRGRMDIVQSWTVPEDLPPGWYRPMLQLKLDEQITPEPDTSNTLTGSDKLGVRREPEVWLPVIRIGDPPEPRVPWCLLTETAIDGSRGPCAIEDREHFAIAARIATPSEPFVVPRIDSRSGHARRYRLEPFTPSVSVGDRGIAPSPPLIPFRFPSGSLIVEIERPDGSVERIGPAPFRQPRSRTLVSRSGEDIGRGGGHIASAYQLSTMDPAFEVQFEQDGPHTIRLQGWIEDQQGNVWTGAGTYELVVGRVLDLDPAILPGTPFEVGDTVTLSAVIRPGVPALVTWNIRLVPGDGDEAFERTIQGSANRFGHYQGESVTLDREGEYRIDVHATFEAPGGEFWSGSMSWGGVVASPGTDVIAHGRRGVDSIAGIGPQWFVRDGDRVPADANGHMFIPFATGDIQWAENRDAALPIVTMEDPSRSVTRVLWPPESVPLLPHGEEQIQVGEIELRWTRVRHRDAYLDPGSEPLWAYSYRSIQRPGARVREQIGEFGPSLYWRFDEHYDLQYGVGEQGDLPNDFKFQFGGVVVRGPAIEPDRYAVYGSLFVLVPDTDDPQLGSRVFPPFQGSAGGPSGGPIMTVKNEPIDIFFHPTGVRPGTTLVRGDRASFSGQIGPTLPSKVAITIVSPSGTVRTIEGQANKVGYFYDPASDFPVDEVGVWTAAVRVWHDGLTSAGAVQPPFPEGDVLGSRDGEYWFYVVDAAAAGLNVEVSSESGMVSPAGVRFVRPAHAPVRFSVRPPEVLTDAEFHYTTVMPGFVLEEGRLTSSVASPSAGFSYSYDAAVLHEDFPNLDLHDADGFAGVDTITLSFLVSGRDGSGTNRHFARQVVLQGEELLAPEQQPDRIVINPGLNGAWFDAATPGQGFFMEVFPVMKQLFVAWFTYDTTQAEQIRAKAQVGDDNHRWLTAQGPFDGDSASLEVFVTRGGLFDDRAAVTTTPAGSMTVTFTDCGAGSVDYGLTAAELSGSIPIGRLADDNVALCETMDGGEAATQKTTTGSWKTGRPESVAKGAKGAEEFQINPGLNGAWFNPATPGQGYLLEVLADLNLVFLSWFTYDTSQPEKGGGTRVGDPGHRWLTAQGSFDGNSAQLEVTLTTGGLFDDPAPVTNTPAGTMTLTFQDCATGTLDYELTAGLAGTVPIIRLAHDNIDLCQLLDSVARAVR